MFVASRSCSGNLRVIPFSTEMRRVVIGESLWGPSQGTSHTKACASSRFPSTSWCAIELIAQPKTERGRSSQEKSSGKIKSQNRAGVLPSFHWLDANHSGTFELRCPVRELKLWTGAERGSLLARFRYVKAILPIVSRTPIAYIHISAYFRGKQFFIVTISFSSERNSSLQSPCFQNQTGLRAPPTQTTPLTMWETTPR